MPLSIEGVTSQSLTLPEELLLMLLSPESGYFHQVPGWSVELRRRRRGTGGTFAHLSH